MTRTIALLTLLAMPASAVEFSLKGTWKTTLEQPLYCDKPAPVQIEHVDFEIQDAPYLKQPKPAFDYAAPDVYGAVSVKVHIEHQRYLETIISGILVGSLVRKPQKVGESPLMLQGYILSKERYGAWLANNKPGLEPGDAGEVELEVTGSVLDGYTLTGVLRSGDACSNVSRLESAVRDLTGRFGRGVPSRWSAKVTLKKQ